MAYQGSGNYSDYPAEGTPLDPTNHVVNSVPLATQHYAGDVLPIPGELSQGSGQTSSAINYALGKQTDPKVKSIGTSTLKDFYGRRSGK